MSEHQHTGGRWFTEPVARRTILKASAALTAMISVPPLLGSPNANAQESAGNAPTTRSGYFSEVLTGEGFSLASEEPHTFQAAFPFSAIGAHWAAEAPENCFVIVELSYDGDSWTDPFELHVSHDGHEANIDGRHFSHLLPSNGHQFVRYRTFSPSGGYYVLPDLVFTYIDAFDGPSQDEFGVSLADANIPTLISRSGWGADERLRHVGQDPNNAIIDPPRYETWRHAVIHHSVTTNGADAFVTMRSIYYYHAITRGWGDIGYNVLVDHNGNIFEGHFGGEHVIGAHSGPGFNAGTAGICCLGTFSNVDVTANAQAAVIAMVAWIIRKYDPHEEKMLAGRLLPTILGHRNVAETECPGNVLYSDLPFIRDAVANVLAAYQPEPGSLPSGQAVQIVTSGANVRSGPGKSFSIVRTLAAGTTGSIDGGPRSVDGYTWYLVKTTAGSGWMATTNFSTVVKPPGAFKKGDTVRTVDSVAMRSAAGLSHEVLTTLPAGVTLKITYAYNRADGYEWYKVEGAVGTGWVAGSFLALFKPPGKFAQGDNVVVNTDSLSLRAAAGNDKAVLATMPRGTALTITYAYNSANGYEWYKVTGPNGAGWAAGVYLSKAKPPGKFSAGDNVMVDTDSLSLRAAAGNDKAVLATMPRGTALTVTYAYNSANGYEWYKVTGSYGAGWSAGAYLSAAGGSGTKPIKVDFTVYVTGGPVNMRSQPSLSGSVLHLVANGSKFQVIDGPRSANGYTWWRVRNNQYGSGWIAADFLERR